MKEFIFKSLYYFGVPSLLRKSKKDAVTVLNLHRISEERDYFYNPIKPTTFYKIIDYCCKHYTITSFEKINQPTTKPKLILSFDDGYYDFIDCALPYLNKLGIPSNHNVVNECINNNTPIWTQHLNDLFSKLKEQGISNDTDISVHSKFNENWSTYYLKFFHYLLTVEKIERTNILQKLINRYNVKSKCKMMNWQDIKYCSQNGVEIGSHSYHHDSLGSIKHTLDYENEINLSIKEISEKINKKVNVFALPNGQYNNKVVDYIKTTDIEYLLVVDDRINPNTFSNKLNIISRIGLNDSSIYETILKTELFHTKIKGMR